ncbi:MAG: transposase [Porticoccaceae bacterium]
MARPLRLEFPNAIYHVTARGNARSDIFLDDEDRELFLVCLGEVVTRFGWLCHAYCLMGNHYHLMIETPEGNLSLGMRQLNGVYTQRFNRRHGRVGPLFQGRYKAILVDRDSYLLELCRYVVLNPIRAGMVKKIERYGWSSYPATLGLAACPAWLATDWILGQFAKTRAVARRRYAQFVAEGAGLASPWPEVRGQALLGSEDFVEKMRPLLEAARDLKEIPRPQRLLHRPSLASMFTKAVHGDKARRDAAIRQAYLDYGYSMAMISRYAGVHYSTVSKVIKGER